MMTKEQIEAVFDRVRTWPVERQEDAAEMLLMMEEQGVAPYELSEEERVEIEAALAEADRGEFATDEEVEAVFNRYRRA
jgi:predicted transcriptional regulator